MCKCTALEARCLRLDGSANTSLLAPAGAAAAQRAPAEGRRAVELRGATGDVAAVQRLESTLLRGLGAALLCLVLAADPPQLGVAPCAAAPHGAALRFEWSAASRNYCATLFSALGFDVHRCVIVGGADGGAAVAIRERKADETDAGRRGVAGARRACGRPARFGCSTPWRAPRGT
eukprot:scaffold63079_cov56-Phaeocystis_antarctica.AAC.3